MTRLVCTCISLFCLLEASSQPVTERALIYQVPEMNKVIIRENIEFRKIGDTSLKLDIYYPPAFDKRKPLPVVVFNNGVGVPEFPKWQVYKDWAKLMAAHGLIAVNYQTRRGYSLIDGEALIDHLIKQAGTYNIDPEKIGVWTCSANTPVGVRLAHKLRPKNIRVLVVYYGYPDSLGQLRQDLPTLIVRAGLDAQTLNIGVENFVNESFKQDTRLEVINYLEGIHAFDVYTNTEESKATIRRTIEFMKTNLEKPVPLQSKWILTNRNFMWLIATNQLETAIAEFRKAREKYRADSTFHPFYNAVIREDVLNTNAYWLLRNHRQQQALEVFKLAVESYPESPNAYDGLADVLEALGDRSAALSNAEKALQKLETAKEINPQFQEAIRRSATEKVNRLKER